MNNFPSNVNKILTLLFRICLIIIGSLPKIPVMISPVSILANFPSMILCA